MFKTRISFFLFMLAVITGILFVALSFFSERLNVVFLLVGIILFSALFFAAEITGGILGIQKEEKKRKESMKPCPHCEAPLYPEDDSCPYCGKKQEGKQTEEATNRP